MNLYRRFLKSALLFTLTGGTGLGAWALIVMAMRERLGGIERGVIQVHAHWQLFGWVGLFVVGVAYQILPRLTGRPLPSYRAASWSFVALAAGVVLRVGQSFDPSVARSTLVYGGALLELLGCGIFAWTVAKMLAARHVSREPYRVYLGLGTAGLVAAACLNLAHARDLIVSGRFEVAAWLNVPYLTLFLVGFVTFWILGVSLRALPVHLGIRIRPRLASGLAVPLAFAVALLAISEAMFLRTGGDTARIVFGWSGIAVALGLALFTRALGIFSGVRGDARFIRLAYAWLVLTGLMLAGLSIATLRGRSLDHAYVGAYRHALTVGFITTMMMGMAYHLVPVFRGAPLWSTRFKDLTFWLLGSGSVVRVVGQGLSAAAGPVWLRVAGISGVLELAALVLFAVNLWKTMDQPGGAAVAHGRCCDGPGHAA